MIEELCAKLKEKRKKLGYSIEHVVERTKLYPLAIRDIESCSLSNISSAYVKGFIKIYASFLEVEVGSALEDIKSQQPGKKIEKKGKKEKIEKQDKRSAIERTVHIIKQIPPEAKKKILVVLAGILLLWCFFIAGKFIFGKIAQMFAEKPKQAQQSLAEPPAPPVPAAAEEKIIVSLTAKKRIFLRAIVDGEVFFEGVLNKGTVENWEGNKEIEFKISDGSAVYLEVNGKPIPTLTSIRRPIKSLKITPSGISVDK